MPSPFPGMDPFLENRMFWRGVHSGLIFTLNQQLNARLPDGFLASSEERVYVAGPGMPMYPDVLVRRDNTPIPETEARGGTTAVLERASVAEDALPRPKPTSPAPHFANMPRPLRLCYSGFMAGRLGRRPGRVGEGTLQRPNPPKSQNHRPRERF